MKPVSAAVAALGMVTATDVVTAGIATIGVASNVLASDNTTSTESVCAGAADDVGAGAVGSVAAVLLVVVDVEVVVALGAGASGGESLGTTPATTIVLKVDAAACANGKNSHIAL